MYVNPLTFLNSNSWIYLIHFLRRAEHYHLFIFLFFIFDITIFSKSSYPSKFNSLSLMSQFAHDSVIAIILGLFSIIYKSNTSILFITLLAFKNKQDFCQQYNIYSLFPSDFFLQLSFIFSFLPFLLQSP